MEIRKVNVTQINPAIYNPRKDLQPEDPEYQGIKQSLEVFGYIDPLIWNCQTGSLVGGHQRFKILLEQGRQEVEVSVVDLPLDQEKMLNLALNKKVGLWDYKKLAELLDELTKLPDFDTSITGFDKTEVSQIFDRYLNFLGEDNFDFEKEVNSIDSPVTKKGDLILIGPHRILCGDSTNSEDIKKLMGDEKADVSINDLPYRAGYKPGNRPVLKKGKRLKQGRAIQNDSLPQAEYEIFMRKALKNILDSMKSGAAFYVWNGFMQFGPMTQMLTQLGAHVSNIITWIKPTICLSFSDYNFASEFLIYGWTKGKHKWYGAANESNVWEVPRDSVSMLIHQNQKPIQLCQRALRNSSLKGDLVLDAFLGSGSSILAADSLGRRCYGIEIESRFIDALIKRYAAFKGKGSLSPDIRKKYLKED